MPETATISIYNNEALFGGRTDGLTGLFAAEFGYLRQHRIVDNLITNGQDVKDSRRQGSCLFYPNTHVIGKVYLE